MLTLNRLIFAFIYGGLLCASHMTEAQQREAFGDYVIHYNTVTTDFLQPQIARLYGITRSSNRAILTVTVLKKRTRAAAAPVRARIQVNAVNLNNQIKSMTMREIIEGGAIYYIGEFPISNEETLDFDLQVSTHDGISHAVAFRRQFFTD